MSCCVANVVASSCNRLLSYIAAKVCNNSCPCKIWLKLSFNHFVSSVKNITAVIKSENYNDFITTPIKEISCYVKQLPYLE